MILTRSNQLNSKKGLGRLFLGGCHLRSTQAAPVDFTIARHGGLSLSDIQAQTTLFLSYESCNILILDVSLSVAVLPIPPSLLRSLHLHLMSITLASSFCGRKWSRTFSAFATPHPSWTPQSSQQRYGTNSRVTSLKIFQVVRCKLVES